ncbi:MAG TPA: lipid II flippase MurJ, partial [Blastocatellia bacterium]
MISNSEKNEPQAGAPDDADKTASSYSRSSILHPPSSRPQSVARSAGIVSIAVMGSRILGLVREMVFSSFFGASFANAAFLIAFRIPNLLRDLFAEGALSAAFVATFSQTLTKQGEREAW